MVGALRKPRHSGGEAHLGEPARLDMRPRRAHELVLLPSNHERVGHFALEQAEVEHGDELARDTVAKMEDRRDQCAASVRGKGFVGELEFGQHLHRRRMDGGGALVLRRLGLGLHQGDRDALLDQRERGDGPDGTGTDHDHPIVPLRHQTFEISNIEG
jgi:hypothetical protein